ncbi:MAG: hypothetical protein N3J91_06930 [Verrucomicrobiae bacterium]|nr:hypothetical protein [Verrucomicrobiae bacterium]
MRMKEMKIELENEMVRRVLHPAVRVLDEREGLVEYIASDETVDSYREVIRADGWRFSRFEKNAPFVDSHRYDTVDALLGRVVDYGVRGRKLIEIVKWAIDVPENRLAQIGWAMTRAGYLRAVSVGFQPVEWVSRWNPSQAGQFAAVAAELGLEAQEVEVIYLAQEQIELSAVVIGANPNAVARSYKAGALSDEDIEFLSRKHNVMGHSADGPARALLAEKERARLMFLRRFEAALKGL